MRVMRYSNTTGFTILLETEYAQQAEKLLKDIADNSPNKVHVKKRANGVIYSFIVAKEVKNDTVVFSYWLDRRARTDNDGKDLNLITKELWRYNYDV
jgi:hypothetical protein